MKWSIAAISLLMVFGAPFVAVASKNYTNATGYGVDIEGYNAVEISMRETENSSN